MEEDSFGKLKLDALFRLRYNLAIKYMERSRLLY